MLLYCQYMKNWLNIKNSFAFLFILLFSIFSFQIQASSLPEKYPRVANYYLDPQITNDEAKNLAKWDLVIIGMEQQYNNPEIFKIMREANPDIIILAYVLSEEVPEQYLSYTDTNYPQYQLYSALFSHPDWYLNSNSGESIYFWPGQRLLNVNSEWKNYLPQWMHDNVMSNSDYWDGIYYDNCFNDIAWINNDLPADIDSQWKSGMTAMLKKSRELEGKNNFLVCNSGGEYYSYINGRLIEAFPSDYDGGWDGAMKKYFNVMKEGKDPEIVIVNTNASNGSESNYQQMRYNLTSTLLNNGFASFDKSMGAHAQTWWYDEYDVVLGDPLSSAYNTSDITNSELKAGVWRRDFEKGVVLLNATSSTKKVNLEKGYEKINGTQDTDVNSGQLIGSVSLPAKDGIIILGRIDSITQASYINGAQAKVYNSKGKIKRNSFFSYDSNYDGGVNIIKIADKNKTIIASETYVEVYQGDNLKYKFAPFGTNFKGGISIAVDRLYSKKSDQGKYYLVVGSKSSGAHVRIYDLKGNLKNSGFFPFGSNFKGGVSVSIGEFDKKRKGKEIVVGAGAGGGPQVLIFSNKGKLVRPGFIAYASTMRSGINVAAGDVNYDGVDDIVVGTNLGAAPQVRIFRKNGKVLSSFYAFSKNDRNGVAVAVSDIEGNGKKKIIASSFSIFNY